ncbi:TPA: hypothetical protein N0F65_002175, partial [Lagenidium giganteum]
MMLWGVVADDSLLFRLCLYVGVALILFDTVVPMLFRRRVKLVWPRRARPRRLFPRAPVLPREEFRRRKRALEEEIRVLERREERRAKRRSRRREQPRIARRLVDSAMTEPIVPSGLAAEDVFSSEYQQNEADASDKSSPLGNLPSLAKALPAIDDKSPRIDVSPSPLYTQQSESTLMEALLVGNFEVAVNCCLHYNQFADALLLASCGGPELWEKTQRAFFAHQTRPVMRVVSAIIKNELYGLVEQSALSDWRQTLAILSTYAKSEEFPALCDKLASQLEAAGDLQSATLCYMCAVNVEKTVAAWVKESEAEAKIRGYTFALQRLVEKVSIFSQAVSDSDQAMGPDVASRFAEYSSLMAAQGRLDIAAKYARFSDVSCAILRDRIYNAAPVQGYQPPPFPFDVVNVIPITQQQQQAQAYGQQSYAAAGQYGATAAGQYGAQATGYGAQAAQGGYGAAQATTVGYGAAQPAAGNYGATQATPAGYGATAGYGAAQATPAYQAQAPTPAYNRPTPAQPSYQAPQATPYGAPAQQSGYGAQPQQPAYPGQTQQTGYGGQQPGNFPAPQQPGTFNRPAQPSYPGQTPGFSSGPPSTGGGAAYGFNAGGNVPVPQGTGVNPLTAQTSLTSSRIAKPSVDMNSQKKDGFVSSVGNKELTLKYGNATTAVLSPMGGAGGEPANKFENVIPGSTENVTP